MAVWGLVTPTRASVVCRLFRAKGNFSSGETSAPPYTTYKNLPIRGDYQRQTFLTCLEWDKLLFTKHLLLFCNDPLKPLRHHISFLIQNVLSIFPLFLNLWMWGLWFSTTCGVPMYIYVLHLVIFLLICVMSIWWLVQPK